MFIRSIIIDLMGNKKKIHLTTLYWSMISSLPHLVGLRPRVYYTLTNFRGGGGARSPCPSPSIRQCITLSHVTLPHVTLPHVTLPHVTLPHVTVNM